MLKKYLQILLICIFTIGTLQFAQAGDKIKLKLHQPPPNKMPVSSLWQMDIENTTRENVTIYLVGSASGDRQGDIVRGTSKPFSVKPGKHTYGYEDFKSGEVKWSNKSIKEIIIRTGEVPEDNYTICVTAYYEDGKVADQQQCITQPVKRDGIITLISPSDGEELKPEEPINFLWTGTGLKGPYTIKVVEIIGNQSPEEAFKENRSFFEKKDINATNFQYPISEKKFVAGKKYAWIVSFEDAKSEIWVFALSKRNPNEEKKTWADYIKPYENMNLGVNEKYRMIGIEHNAGLDYFMELFAVSGWPWKPGDCPTPPWIVYVMDPCIGHDFDLMMQKYQNINILKAQYESKDSNQYINIYKKIVDKFSNSKSYNIGTFHLTENGKSFSGLFKHYYRKCINNLRIIKLGKETIATFQNNLTKIQEEILKSNILYENEKDILLSGISILKYSVYWHSQQDIGIWKYEYPHWFGGDFEGMLMGCEFGPWGMLGGAVLCSAIDAAIGKISNPRDTNNILLWDDYTKPFQKVSASNDLNPYDTSGVYHNAHMLYQFDQTEGFRKVHLPCEGLSGLALAFCLGGVIIDYYEDSYIMKSVYQKNDPSFNPIPLDSIWENFGQDLVFKEKQVTLIPDLKLVDEKLEVEIRSFSDLLSNNKTDFKTTIEEIKKFESRIIKNDSYNDDQKKKLLNSTSITRYSLLFNNNYQKMPFYNCINVAQWDFIGSLFGLGDLFSLAAEYLIDNGYDCQFRLPIKVGNSNNPYDDAGIKHNMILEKFFQSEQYEQIKINLNAHKKEDVGKYLTQFFKNNYPEFSLPFDIDSILASRKNLQSPEDWIKIMKISPSRIFLSYSKQLISVAMNLSKTELSSNDFRRIINLEAEMMNDKSINNSDLKSLLKMASVLRYSISYWQNHTEVWPYEGPIDWSRVGCVDGIMAVVGSPACGAACSILDYLFQDMGW